MQKARFGERTLKSDEFDDWDTGLGDDRNDVGDLRLAHGFGQLGEESDLVTLVQLVCRYDQIDIAVIVSA